MKVVGVFAAIFGVLAATTAALIWIPARRIVGTKTRRKTVTVRRIGDEVELPRSELTVAGGNYGLWFGDGFEHHALFGPVVSSDPALGRGGEPHRAHLVSNHLSRLG